MSGLEETRVNTMKVISICCTYLRVWINRDYGEGYEGYDHHQQKNKLHPKIKKRKLNEALSDQKCKGRGLTWEKCNLSNKVPYYQTDSSYVILS